MKSTIPWLPGILSAASGRMLLSGALAGGFAISAMAAAPANDRFDGRTQISSLPYQATEGIDMTFASLEPGEPLSTNQWTGLPINSSLWWELPIATPGLYVAEIPFGIRNWGIVEIFSGESLSSLSLLAGGIGQASVRNPQPGRLFVRIALSREPLFEKSVSLLVRRMDVATNDAFASAIPVTGTSWSSESTTVGSTFEAGEPSVPELGGSIWWRWVAPGTGTFLVRSDHNVRIGLYPGAVLGSLGSFYSIGATELPFRAVQGATYHFAVFRWGMGLGAPVNLSMSEGAKHDDFAQRQRTPGNSTSIDVDNVGGTVEPGEMKDDFFTLSTTWYEWTPPVGGTWEANFIPNAGVAAGFRVSAYHGTELSQLTELGSMKNGSTRVPLKNLSAGKPVSIRVSSDSWGAVGGKLQFELGAANDSFADRMVLSGATNHSVTASNFGATREPGEPQAESNAAARSVWWEWVPPVSGGYTVQAHVSGRSLPVWIYKGDHLAGLQPATLHEESRVNTAIRVTEPGTKYFIAVTDREREPSTTFRLEVRQTRGNDVPERAIDLPARPSEPGDSIARSDSMHEAAPWPGTSPEDTRSLWYRWKPDAAGVASVDFRRFQIYRLAGSERKQFFPDGSAFATVPGETYLLQLQGTSSDGSLLGAFTVKWLPAPAHDSFSTPRNLTLTEPALVDVPLATMEFGEPSLGPTLEKGTLWWRYSAPSNGNYGFALSGSGLPRSRIDFLRGDHLGQLEVLGTIQNIAPGLGLVRDMKQGDEIFVRVSIYEALGIEPLSDPVGVRVYPVAPNDRLENRVVLPSVVSKQPVAMGTGSVSPTDPDIVSNQKSTVWWGWQPAARGTYFFRLDLGRQTPFRFGTALYRIDSQTNLTRVGGRSMELGESVVSFGVDVPDDNGSYVLAAASDGHYPDGIGQLSIEKVENTQDRFGNRRVLPSGLLSHTETIRSATFEPGEPDPIRWGTWLPWGNWIGNNWYSWTAPSNGVWVVQSWLPHRVFKGESLGTLVPPPASEDYHVTRVSLKAGESIQIAIYVDRVPINLILNIGPEVNDRYLSPATLSGDDVSVQVSNYTATKDLLDPLHSLRGGFDIAPLWWAWTPERNGMLTAEVTTAELGIVPELAVFPSTEILPGQIAKGTTGAVPNQKRLLIPVFAGQKYVVRVGGTAPGSAAISLRLKLDEGGGNDSIRIAGATKILRSGEGSWSQVPSSTSRSGRIVGTIVSPEDSTRLSVRLPGPGFVTFRYKVEQPGNMLVIVGPEGPASNQQELLWRTEWSTAEIRLPDVVNDVSFVLRGGPSSSAIESLSVEAISLEPRVLTATPVAGNQISLWGRFEADKVYQIEESKDGKEWLPARILRPDRLSEPGPVRFPMDQPQMFFRYRIVE